MAVEGKADNSRIMKNSLMLYLRTFFVMAVGLYNSRVVLEVLGVDDFGVYGVVSGIVLMFGFFTNSMANAMSRFLSFEMGAGNEEKLCNTFTASMCIVVVIGAFILLFCETAGLFMFHNLNIPEQSRDAALVVYQLSIATVAITVLQTAFISSIVAHEKMGVFAYVEIANATLRLGAIFMLKYVDANKLILYALLVLVIMLIVTTCMIIYCLRNFKECSLKLRWEAGVIRSMVAYSGWNLVKSITSTLTPTGISYIVNLFFGVVVNAAVAIALNVASNVGKFTSSVFLSFKAQIVKTYAAGEIAEMQGLLYNAFKFSLAVHFVVLIPVIFEMPYILNLWLGQCPEYAATFCRLLCVCTVFEIVIAIVEYGVGATGKMKGFGLCNGLLTLSILVIGWMALRLGAPPSGVYVVQIAVTVVMLVADFLILKRLIPQVKIDGALKIFVAVAVIVFASCVLCYVLRGVMSPSFGRLVALGSVNVGVIAIGGYLLLLSRRLRAKINSKICGVFVKK